MTCKTCMTMRAKLVLWLGKKLGVMEDAKPEPKKEEQMEFTPQQALIKIGALALENDVLLGQLQQVAAERDALKAKYEHATENKLKEVK